MLPNHFIRSEGLPRTNSGKLDRRALGLDGGSADPDHDPSAGAAPTTELERRLARLWREVLDGAMPGPHENFFECGGDSLRALVMVARLERELGRTVDLPSVFDAKDLADMARRIASDPGAARPAVVSLRTGGGGAPLFCLYGIDVYREFARRIGGGQPVVSLYVPAEREVLMSKGAGVVSVGRNLPALLRADRRILAGRIVSAGGILVRRHIGGGDRARAGEERARGGGGVSPRHDAGGLLVAELAPVGGLSARTGA